jgi:formiminotetrahydrofolate cyclodeaminase
MTSLEADLRFASLSVEDFLTKLADNQPAPGGGSAIALAGAMAGALACMVTGLTIGRERYAANQQQMCGVRARACALRERLTILVDEDARAYQAVIKAYSLPKVTEAEGNLRTSEIRRALRHAAEVPLEAAEACAELIDLAAAAAALGNRNAASDAAVAALLAQAAMRAAVLTVRTNLDCLQDPLVTKATEARLTQLLDTGEVALERALGAARLGDWDFASKQPLP